MAYLEVHTSAGVKKCDLTSNKVTIGRHASNAVIIDDDKLISRHHCQIERSPTGFVLRDLDSRNGTKMDGLEIVSVVLRPGTQFLVGGTVVKFIDDQPAQQPVAAHDHAGMQAGIETDGGYGAHDLDNDDSQAITLDVSTGPVRNVEEEEHHGGTYGIGSFTALMSVGRNVPYGLDDVALINARGQVIHAASGVEARDEDATAEAIDVVRLLMLGCIRTGASDIHLEPKREGGLVRLRIDGAMVEVSKVDVGMYRRLGSLVKILGDIDIAKKGIVQEGHFSVKVPDRRIDYRISFTPSMFGKKW